MDAADPKRPLLLWLCVPALLYLTLYLPLAGMIYLPYWYETNCDWHPRCERLGQERSEQAIAELTQFFAHRGELKRPWSDKEQQHLAEVRQIYDRMLIALGLLSLLLIGCLHHPRLLRKAAGINVLIFLALSAILPFFTPFWKQIFHPLLFDNQLWINTRADQSWYIMPRLFFRNSMALLIVIGAGSNLLLWLLLPSGARSNAATSTPSTDHTAT